MDCYRVLSVAAVLLTAGAAGAQEFDDGWRVVPPDELAMTQEPRAAGAPAIYLYTQVDRDDENSIESVQEQIKVLTEEGRDRANVQIEYDKSNESIRGIRARVLQPDGTIVPFDGTVYDKPVAEGREVKMQAKSFTLPDVRVGSIIEYRFERNMRYNWVYNSLWVLTQDLFTRNGRYSLLFYDGLSAHWGWPNGLPAGTSKPEVKGNRVRLETHNVPALITEPYMPPVNNLKYLVVFDYREEKIEEADPAKYWPKYAKYTRRRVDRFARESGPVRKALEEIVAPGDSPAEKVRKIYYHVQGLRNTDYAPQLDEQEARRNRNHDAGDAGDVAKHGYGDSADLRSYFIALVRAAGVPAAPVMVGSRKERIFDKRISSMNSVSGLVAVTLDGSDVLLDPGTPYLPYGQLDWTDTATPALKLTDDGGEWISTPLPRPGEATTARVAKFNLGPDGQLDGTVRVTYSGREALWRRLQERNDDEPARRDYLESDLKDQLAVPAQINLVTQPDWDNGDIPLQAEFHVTVPQWAVAAGNRMLVGFGLFGGNEKGVFVAPSRIHPIYFDFPFQTEDEMQIVPPAGYRVQAAPEDTSATQVDNMRYSTSAEMRDGALVLHRDFVLNALLSRPANYPKFREFYEAVRTGDARQVVLVH
jgi:hypothetical protein